MYIVLGISILAPIYTYILYPLVLRLFKKKSLKTMDDYLPPISVIIISNEEEKCLDKVRNIWNSDYIAITEIIVEKHIANLSSLLKKAKSDVIVITNDSSVFTKDTIKYAVKPLAESRVGCVSGMVRTPPDENGNYHDGSNWKYENHVKILESNIGCLSGANSAIFAFKRVLAPEFIDEKINLDFYIPTYITEIGYDVIFESKAVAYEKCKNELELFAKHRKDGASGYRSIIKFWKLLFPRKGCFVFWSHRVMKWLVPFNIISIILICGILATQLLWAFIMLVLQLVCYILLVFYYFFYLKNGCHLSGAIGKILDIGSYFLFLNVAWFLGLLKK